MKIIEEIGQEWEPTSNSFSWITDSKIPLRLQGLIMNHVCVSLVVNHNKLVCLFLVVNLKVACKSERMHILTLVDYELFNNLRNNFKSYLLRKEYF